MKEDKKDDIEEFYTDSLILATMLVTNGYEPTGRYVYHEEDGRVELNFKSDSKLRELVRLYEIGPRDHKDILVHPDDYEKSRKYVLKWFFKVW